MKIVTRQEFLDFVNNYPGELERDVVMICEPPVAQYHDWSLAPSGTVVAQCRFGWLGPDGEQDHSKPGKFWEYQIKEKS